MFVIDPNARDIRFPPVELASREGLLAIGGDLSAARLLAAYRSGIFPWYSEGQPAGFIASVVGAIILLALYRAVTGRRRITT